MKEIGGYFGFERLISREYYSTLLALNSARYALLYILRARSAKKIFIPYFLCESVPHMLTRYGFDFEYYNIDENLLPIFSRELEDGEYLYIVNYYGQLSDSLFFEYKRRYERIIVDNVQAFFNNPIEDVDTIYSCRKFFGVADGAYLSTTARLNEPLARAVSGGRMGHVIGRFENCARDYYVDFKKNDEDLKNEDVAYMSLLTHNILGAIDYNEVKRRRNENYNILESSLGGINGRHFIAPQGPYAYPFYFKNGLEIKRKLAEKNIFVPTLWPNVLKLYGTVEKDLAENILPLPCDQRYGAEDMKVIVDALADCGVCQ